MIFSSRSLRPATELAAWVAGRRRRMRIVGPSMRPTLNHGDHVLVDRDTPAEVGELAVAVAPGEPDLEVVKRLERIDESSGACWLTSDNREEGVDSRTWGLVPPERLRGRVTLNLSRMATLTKLDQGPVPRTRWLRR